MSASPADPSPAAATTDGVGVRRRRPGPIGLGAAAGTVPFLLLLGVDLARTPVTEADFFDWPGSILLFGGMATAPVVLLAGVILAVIRRTRRVGIGLLAGGTVAAIVSLYVAYEVLPGIPSLRH